MTINYRLGALGFLALPELAAEDPHQSTGDYALLDQVAALQWVHDNIAAFGGDPSRVLVWGQSAGSASAMFQMASPLTKGLISGAFSESGVDGSGGGGEGIVRAETGGAAYASDLGCADAGSVLNCLRALPAAPPDAGGAYAEAPAPTGYTWAPVVDGYALPTSAIAAFTAGAQNKIPYIIGSTSEEYANPTGLRATPTVANVTTSAQYQAALVTNFASDASAVAAQYPVTGSSTVAEIQTAYVEVLTDSGFTCSTRRIARAIVGSQTQPVYRYWWTHTLSSGPHASWGPAHATDLPMWFDGFVDGFTPTASETALAHEMSEALFLFAANGSPNGADAGIAWPQYTAENDPFVDWDDTPTVDAGVRTARCDFWDSL